MTISFMEVDDVIEELLPVLDEFSWFNGAGVDQDDEGFFAFILVDPQTDLGLARQCSIIPFDQDGVRILFRHSEIADTL